MSATAVSATAVTAPLRRLVAAGREQVMGATRDLFSHGDHPLAHTLSYRGDPGLFGPDSMTWPVVGDAAVFVGGIRALLVQAAHPEVAAGVSQHSRYREDPLGRLTRTASFVTSTAFGAMPEVDAAIDTVQRRHRPVTGVSARGCPYDASDPDLAAWVHNTLTDSFLVAYRVFGPGTCSDADADRYVAEQTLVGVRLGASPLPDTADALAAWVADHPALAPSPAADEAIAFLRNPPLPVAVRIPYLVLLRAAAATLPSRIAGIVGVRSLPGDLEVGRVAVAALRWSLGASPDWRVALERVGAPRPAGVTFRQGLPPAAVTGAGRN